MDLYEKYKKLIEEISNDTDIYGVYIFGSYAKKRQKPMSDLDICFFINPKNINLYNEILSYKSEKFDPSIFHVLPLHVQFEILKYGKPVIIKNTNLFRIQKLKYLRKYHEESGLMKRLITKRYDVKL
jgi:predicted nucleotidyltransferase